MDFEKEFIHYSFEYDGSGEYQDLYFFGIKRMNKIKISKGDNRIYLMPSELVENVTLEIYKDNSIIYTAKSDTLLQEYNYWHQPNSSLDDGLVIVKIFSNDDLVEEKRL